MHVLNISYNNTLGGLEQVFLDYCQYLSDAQCRVTAMVAPDAAITKKIQQHAISFIVNSYIRSKYSYLNPVAYVRLRRLLKAINPDIIVVHNARPLALLQMVARGICPVVVVHHGGNIKRLRRAHNVICVAHYMQKELYQQGHAHETVYYVPNAIAVDRPYRPLKRIQSKELTIGTLGRLAHEKGFDVLLESLRYLQRPYKLIIAGDGPEKTVLKSQAENLPVHFLGWVEDAQREQFFEACDVLVFPSRKEPFGLVILEGWLRSIPVIAARAKGPSELIRDGENGGLVNREDVDGLRDALENLTVQQADQYASEGYKTLEASYSNTQQAKALLRVLQIIRDKY